MSVVEFMREGDDAKYLAWIAEHADGFVLNTRRLVPRPGYMVLHRANCRTIGLLTGDAKPGGFTERTYRKVCAAAPSELSEWVRDHGRTDGSFSKRCGACRP